MNCTVAPNKPNKAAMVQELSPIIRGWANYPIRDMKYIIILLLCTLLNGCADRTYESDPSSRHWSLAIQGTLIGEDYPETTITGYIKCTQKGKVEKRPLKFKLPMSIIKREMADDILEISVNSADYPHPVFFHLVRHNNLNLIKWPQEASKVEFTRMFYHKVENLSTGFTATAPYSPQEIKKEFESTSLNYAKDGKLTSDQLQAASHKLLKV
jgi:hypothetical protein